MSMTHALDKLVLLGWYPLIATTLTQTPTKSILQSNASLSTSWPACIHGWKKANHSQSLAITPVIKLNYETHLTRDPITRDRGASITSADCYDAFYFTTYPLCAVVVLLLLLAHDAVGYFSTLFQCLVGTVVLWCVFFVVFERAIW